MKYYLFLIFPILITTFKPTLMKKNEPIPFEALHYNKSYNETQLKIKYSITKYLLGLEKRKNQEIQNNFEATAVQEQIATRNKIAAILREAKTVALKNAILMAENKRLEEKINSTSEASRSRLFQVTESSISRNGFQDGNLDKRSLIRWYFRSAWESYKLSGWGHAELSYNSRGGFGTKAAWDPAGKQTFWDKGATIVSSLDTLYIMDFVDEYNYAREWVKSFNMSNEPDVLLHVRKTVILYIGGFLSIYALTGDTLFKDKAVHVAEQLLPAFDIAGDSLCTWYHTKKGCMFEEQHRDQNPSPYASLNLEFELLSDITGNEVFRDKMKKFVKAAKTFPRKPQSWFRNSVQTDNFKDYRPNAVDWSSQQIRQSGGTYMDFLLKSWIMGGLESEDLRETYLKTYEQASVDLIAKSSASNLTYATSLVGGVQQKRMAHANCYIGGNFALGGFALGEPFKSAHTLLGEQIANTCHEAYVKSPSKLASSIFEFSGSDIEASDYQDFRYYDFYPQPIETYFILWRLTRNRKYRKWGAEISERYIARFRNHYGVPLTGLKDVLIPNVDIQYANGWNSNERQASHIFAETIKYLYLLFSDDDVLPLDQWVFNANGHPLPIKGSEAYNKIVNIRPNANIVAPTSNSNN